MIFKMRATSGYPVELKELDVKTLGINEYGVVEHEIEINSIEDLLKIVNEARRSEYMEGEHEIIVGKKGNEYYIEIYDTWRE